MDAAKLRSAESQAKMESMKIELPKEDSREQIMRSDSGGSNSNLTPRKALMRKVSHKFVAHGTPNPRDEV